MDKLSLQKTKKSLTGATSGMALLVLALMLALPAWAFAQTTVKVNTLYFTLYPETGTAEVAEPADENDVYKSGVRIPSSISYEGQTYSVTGIGNDAFSFCTGLTLVSVPSTVVKIGDRAFMGCNALNSVQFTSPKYTEIGDYAFSGCEKLASINFPSTLETIGDGAFHACTSLKMIVIPQSVKNIGRNAFMRCTSLGAVNMSNY